MFFAYLRNYRKILIIIYTDNIIGEILMIWVTKVNIFWMVWSFSYISALGHQIFKFLLPIPNDWYAVEARALLSYLLCKRK